jgi:signal transduction histidine kinase
VRLDAAVAALTFAGLTIPAALGVPSSEGHPAAALALGAGAALPIAVRRRWPVPALVAVMASVVASLLLGVRTTPLVSNAGPGVGLTLYTVVVGSHRHGRAWWALALTAAGLSSGELAALALHPDQDQNAVHSLTAVAAWLLADGVRTQRAYRADLAARRRAEQDERARRAVAEERLRISREVHDVVSHSLSVIAVRSGVGRMVAEERPDEARAALATIEDVSRAALDELRRLLSAIREPVGAPGAAELAPMPRLADVGALVEGLAATGLPATLAVEGAERPLSPLLEASAYRIVQESLTNVVRHAGHVPTRVTLAYGEAALAVVVEDDGRAAAGASAGTGPAGPGSGLGLAGMAQRAELFGGTLEHGPRPGGGFRVAAQLPYGGAP